MAIGKITLGIMIGKALLNWLQGNREAKAQKKALKETREEQEKFLENEAKQNKLRQHIVEQKQGDALVNTMLQTFGHKPTFNRGYDTNNIPFVPTKREIYKDNTQAGNVERLLALTLENLDKYQSLKDLTENRINNNTNQEDKILKQLFEAQHNPLVGL